VCPHEESNLFIQAVFMIFGAGVAGFVGFIFSYVSYKMARRSKALDEFIDAFIETITLIEESIPNPMVPPESDRPSPGHVVGQVSIICNSLIKEKPRHDKAIRIVRCFIGNRKFKKIKKAYDHYYNPKDISGKPMDVFKNSFCVYNLNEFAIDKIFHQKISGKQLALDNIKKIIKAASK
jgi:hypothetical protein